MMKYQILKGNGLARNNYDLEHSIVYVVFFIFVTPKKIF